MSPYARTIPTDGVLGRQPRVIALHFIVWIKPAAVSILSINMGMDDILTATCPACEGEIEYSPDDSGKETECPHCQSLLFLPERWEPNEEFSPPPVTKKMTAGVEIHSLNEPRLPPPLPRSKKNASRRTIGILAAAIFVLSVSNIALLITLLGNTESSVDRAYRQFINGDYGPAAGTVGDMNPRNGRMRGIPIYLNSVLVSCAISSRAPDRWREHEKLKALSAVLFYNLKLCDERPNANESDYIDTDLFDWD